MRITRQLRLDRLAADGTAQIQLTIAWEGNRLRLGTSAVVKPEHWDEEQHQVRTVKGTPHAAVNSRLNRASEAAQHAQEAAHRAGRKLPKEELKVDAALTLAPVEEAAPAPAVASDFETLQRQWITEQLHKPRGQSGKPLAATTKVGFEAALQRFLQYQQVRGVALHMF